MLVSRRFHQIITANALLLLEAQHNAALREACEAASLVLPESAGTSWAFRRLGHETPFQLSGVDLGFEICRRAAQKSIRVFLLGGKPGISEAAAYALMERIPGLDIAGTLDGYFDNERDEHVIHIIQESNAGVVLVALGMPRQDIWIHRHRNELSGICIGLGGTFDVWAGKVKRAPELFQKNGLEWLYRFGQEPWRWRRIARLPRFVAKIIGQKNA